jgi:ribonuclease VapC
MADAVLDASAFLALLKGEPGWDRVAAVLPGSVMCSVNAAEVYAKLADWSYSQAEHAKCQSILNDRTIPFDTDLALRSGAMRASTAAKGLSLGDRACLALAQRLGKPAITADKAWSDIKVGVAVQVIR